MNDEKKSPRFHLPGLGQGPRALPDDEAHHARSVLRLKPGDALTVFDGKGLSAKATVLDISRREVRVDVGPPRQTPPVTPAVHLAFAIPKAKRLDWLLEKASELAAASLQPLAFQRSVTPPDASPAKARRWQQHLLAAAKQAGLDVLPALCEPQAHNDWLARQPVSPILYGDLTPEAQPLRNALCHDCTELTLLVGPEGGLTDAERQALQAVDARPVRLGPTTLRVETAALALLAAVRALAAASP